MDNLTHSLVGLTLARTGLNKTTPYATTALVIGANLPDYDILVQITGGTLEYMQTHRGLSHSLLGALVQSIALAVALIVINSFIRRNNKTYPQVKPLPLLIASMLGVFSHVLMDFTNAYGIKLSLPFSDRWQYGDFIFAVDPWIILILGGALFLGSSNLKSANIIAAIATLAALVIFYWVDASITMMGIVLIFAGAIAALRTRIKFINSQRLALIAFAIVAVYHVMMFGFKQRAQKLLLANSSANEVIEQSVAPVFGNVFSWYVFREGDSSVQAGLIENIFFKPEVRWLNRVPKNFSEEPVRTAFGTCTGRTLLEFSRYPAAKVKAVNGNSEVEIFDLRYAVMPHTKLNQSWARGKIVVKDDLSTVEQEACH